MLNTWIFDLFCIESKMTVKTREIRQKEPKGERTFGADCTCPSPTMFSSSDSKQPYASIALLGLGAIIEFTNDVC